MPKKTVAQIVGQHQHYLIALKANQRSLYRTVEQLHQAGHPLSEAETYDTSHTRQGHRRVSVYAAPTALQQHWAGLTHLIWVERWGTRNGQPFQEHVAYLSNLDLDAADLLSRIQQHWVRDVTFEEDHARPGGNAPVIWALLNCFLITIIRHLGYRTIPQGLRVLANQVKRVFEYLTQGFPPPK